MNEYLTAAVATARITTLLLLRRRRILFLGLLVLLPALFPLIVAWASGPYRRPGSYGLPLFTLLAEYTYLATLAPLGAILLGTALVGDDLEGGTSIYLLTRPAPRSALVLGKVAAYVAVMSGAFLPALLLTFISSLAVSPVDIDLASSARFLAQTSGVVGLAILVYGALCLFLGAATQRPVIYSAVFVFGWEPLTRIVPGYVDFLTIRKHLLALWPAVTLGDGLGSVEVSRRVIDVSVEAASLALLAIAAALVVATTWTLRRREFVGGQTLG